MPLYGLIGHPVSHSFSKDFFTGLFEREKLTDYSYELFDLKDLQMLPELIRLREPAGLNVTIPHKTTVLDYLDEIDPLALEAGAVNCINIEEGKLVGYNTDTVAIRELIAELSLPAGSSALIFGSGGASRAVSVALGKLKMPFTIVSRTPSNDQLNYGQLNKQLFGDNQLLINCTPVGMWPKSDERLVLPYEFIKPHHIAIDLIYNPSETHFLRECRLRGATTMNGLKMLHRQAALSWKIWQGKG